MVIYSRLLMYISDLDEPLTPLHLLVSRRLMSYPDHLLTTEYEHDSDEEDIHCSSQTWEIKIARQTLVGSYATKLNYE